MADLISALSVWLFFLGILFEYSRRTAVEIIEKPSPDRAKTTERKKRVREINGHFWLLGFALISELVTLRVLFPKTLSQLRLNNCNPFLMDELESVYLLIISGILVFTVISIYHFIKLIKKRYDLKQ